MGAMDRTTAVLITLGCLFLLGLATQIVGRRSAVPLRRSNEKRL